VADGDPPIPPNEPHRSTPREIKERLEAERSGRPHLIYRDGDQRQLIHFLTDVGRPVTVGRAADRDVSLGWDAEVSRLHATLEAAGTDWLIADDGLSRNGTFLNGERIVGQRRLSHDDLIVVGRTALVYRSAPQIGGMTTRAGGATSVRESVSDADRRLLIALCRPLKEPRHTVPATNRAIADELHLAVPTVKKRLSALFIRFGIDDLPQAQKRSRLAVIAFESGIVTMRDL
jgi:pSer/pThr/pTyr-binding forkhead associated (FHA) protein